jgi:hypothetical protein
LLHLLFSCRCFLYAGLTVTELLLYAALNNLMVYLGVFPNHADLTIGGRLVPGAHGIKGSSQAHLVGMALLRSLQQ